MIKKYMTLLSLSLIGVANADTTVFAASSTTDVMRELAATFEKNGGEKIRFNFASSGALARQLEAGARAGLFISANVKWMDWLQEKKIINPTTRTNLFSNSLVLIAPSGQPLEFNGNIKGRVSVGNFKSVPVGMYAQEALTHMGWMDDLRPNLVMTSNARMALLYVKRGEVAAGIVYSTDARKSDQVSVVGSFPADSHPPILYPAACLADASGDAHEFLKFMQSEIGKTIWIRHGFRIPE